MKKILVVDDEPSIRRLLNVALTNRGFEVVEARDGLEGVALAVTEKPDLIVLDVMMPGLNGHQVRERLRGKPETKETPILFLSAAGTYEEQRKQMAADPLVDYLPKPFKPSDVASHIAAMLDPRVKDQVDRERGRREATLNKIVEIMHRERE